MLQLVLSQGNTELVFDSTVKSAYCHALIVTLLSCSCVVIEFFIRSSRCPRKSQDVFHYSKISDIMRKISFIVPGDPRKVKIEPLNSTAIGVQWQSPAARQHNGIIRGYQIHYVQVTESSEPIGDPMVLEIESTKTEAVLSNLVPDAYYQVQVAAYTRKGEGERTRSKKVKTKGAGDVPSQLVANIRFIDIFRVLSCWHVLESIV